MDTPFSAGNCNFWVSGVVRTGSAAVEAGWSRPRGSADSSAVAKFFVRLDVTEGFPFLATKLSPYYDG